MCRSQIEGGRRCTCDNSAARRLRRHNAQAIQEFTGERTPLLERTEVEDVPLNVEQISMENIKALTADIDVLKDLMERSQRFGNMVEETITLSDGTEIELNPLTNPYELAEFAEAQTLKLGNTIQALVEERTGITDDSIVARSKALLEEAEVAYNASEKIRNERSMERAAKWPTVRDEEGKTVTGSTTAFFQAMQDGDEEALAWSAEDKRLAAEHQIHYTNLLDAKSGNSKETKEALATNRAEMLTILKDVREIGGTINVAENSAKPALKTLQDVQQVYPAAWIAASNERPEFRAKVTARRAHYSDGSFQKSYKVTEKKRVTFRDKDWEPGDPNSPLDRNDVGEWHRIPENGAWEDPETGMKYEASSYRGEAGWVYTPVEFYRSWNDEERTEAPPGRGWKSALVKERVRDYNNDGKFEDVVRTRWYRPIKERKLVEAKIQPELTISGKGAGAYSVGVHEFAHRVESTPKIGRYIETLEEQFLERRTTDADGNRQPLETIYKGTRERGRPDNFVDKYMGKEYSQGYREVLSTGAESVIADRFGGLIGLGGYKADPEMKSLIVGLWASA